MSEESIHDLLPWFVNRTLTGDEQAAFERHLPGCAACAREVRALEQLRDEVARHGEALFSEHPSPETLAALEFPALGDVAADRADEVQRHVAVCPTCAEEVTWLRGEAEAVEVSGASVPRRLGDMTWAAAAAAVVLLGLALALWLRPDAGPGTDLIAMVSVEPTQRTAGDPVEILVAPGAREFHLFVALDLIESELPATVRIDGAEGRTVFERRGVGFGDLHEGRFLFVRCDRGDFPDGSYVIHIVPDRADVPPGEYPFGLGTAPAR